MSSSMARDGMTETYYDVVDLIRHTVHGFMRQHGSRWGTYDELFARANYDFVEACRSYDNGRGSSFSTWCRWVVLKGMLEHQRNVIRRDRQCRVSVKDMTRDNIPMDVRQFRYTELLEDMGDDAQFVTRLTVHTPKVLLQCMREAKGSDRRNARAVIRQYLYGRGWSPERVTGAFQEIEKAIA